MKPLHPLPHQAEAVAAVIPGLRKHGRGQVIMACGTGKTLIGPLVADRMQAKTILVQVPSLLLARQLLGVYRRQWPRASYLAVCSDIDRVATEDSPSVDDVGCEATTDSDRVKKFLKTGGRRVVIATYQSARVLEDRRFDGAIFDEAHRTAGVKGKPFAFGLHDKNVRCDWRLFMTATPRHAEITSEEGETEEVYSMDDSELYGSELYKLSFRKAIDLGLIVDYRIVVSVFKLPKNPGATATQIALRQAMSRYGASKVFTFHNTIAKASTFIESASALRGVHLSHVNGMQPSADRARALREFAESDQAIMSNVRCLTEGVDLPSCDMVAFMDPKKSMVEIVQAIGRAMRTSPGKKRALIFLPIFVQEKDGEDLEAAAQRTGFAKLHEILQAVQEQDKTMAARLGEIRSGERSELPENVELDVEEESFRGASQGVVERIRKYVTVRILKPFKRLRLTEQDFLDAAKRGEPKPMQGTAAYGKLIHLMLSNTVFQGRIRNYWRFRFRKGPFAERRTYTEEKAISIQRAAAGKPRWSQTSPDKEERRLASIITKCSQVTSIYYDEQFRIALTKLGWIPNSHILEGMNQKQHYLLAAAKNRHIEYKEHVRYTRENSPAYNAVFTAKLKRLQPLVKQEKVTGEKGKKRIIRGLEHGKAPKYYAWWSYAHPNSPRYDKDFADLLKMKYLCARCRSQYASNDCTCTPERCGLYESDDLDTRKKENFIRRAKNGESAPTGRGSFAAQKDRMQLIALLKADRQFAEDIFRAGGLLWSRGYHRQRKKAA